MNNIVETSSGEIVEITNGVLTCKHTKENWLTISEWCIAQDHWDLKIEIRIEDTLMFVETPDNVPAHRLQSLLEAFNYQ